MASSVFTGDIQSIVLTPIENMINMIELICAGIETIKSDSYTNPNDDTNRSIGKARV